MNIERFYRTPWWLRPLTSATLALGILSCLAGEPAPIELPKPRMDAGRPLMQALKDRKSTREYSADQLPSQVLSDLLWAAFGVNRPDSGHRTAPSTMNCQGIDLYVSSADGLFIYDPKAHRLNPVSTNDVRSATGQQEYVKQAPVELIFVADYARMEKVPVSEREFYAAADTGFISQNVYLFCASEGLGTVVHAVDKQGVAKAMNLRPDQKVVLAQAVGYPKK